MHIPSPLLALAAGALALLVAPHARADSVLYFSAPHHYYSVNHSPYSSGGGSFRMENFEDGVLNTLGVTANRGNVKGPGSNTDSVDGDDGNINGLGRNGHSFTSGSSKSITFNFAANAQGERPTMAGLVWTDGRKNSRITLKAWDSGGDYIGKIRVTLGDLKRHGKTAEDRFLGFATEDGISKLKIMSNYAGFEIDHLQFAYGFAVVPLPAPLLLGLAGLGSMVLHRRFGRARNPID